MSRRVHDQARETVGEGFSKWSSKPAIPQNSLTSRLLHLRYTRSLQPYVHIYKAPRPGQPHTVTNTVTVKDSLQSPMSRSQEVEREMRKCHVARAAPGLSFGDFECASPKHQPNQKCKTLTRALGFVCLSQEVNSMSWRVQRSRQPVDLDLRPSASGEFGIGLGPGGLQEFRDMGFRFGERAGSHLGIIRALGCGILSRWGLGFSCRMRRFGV